MTEVWGFADLHCHPMAHLAFGGLAQGKQLFWGDPYGPMGQALPCCRAAHGWTSGLLPTFVEAHGLAHPMNGAPAFDGWPAATTILHQQMHVEWLYRAYCGGLRLMVASAVNNELLGRTYHGGNDEFWRDAQAIEAQLAAMHQFAARPECADWMAVVTSAAAARAAITSGKLAIVLGVEVDSLGGGPWRDDGDGNPAATDQLLDYLVTTYGVRLLTPLHLANNAYGGCAVFDDKFNCSNHYLRERYKGQGQGAFYEVDPSLDTDGVAFKLGVDGKGLLSVFAYAHGYPDYVAHNGVGHRNRRGLSALGRHLLYGMMKRAMIIDIDHMSQHSAEDALTLAETYGYPMVASHTGFRELGLPAPLTPGDMTGVASEYMQSRRAVDRLVAVGGLLGLGTRSGPLLPATHGCLPGFTYATGTRPTSFDWAHAFLYGVERLGGRAIALGTDFNGLPMQAEPRYPNLAANVGRRIDYGRDTWTFVDDVLKNTPYPPPRELSLHQVDERVPFDFNEKGLASVALLPDFLRDVANLYGKDDYLAPLYRSAEAFLQLWETCEARSVLLL